MNPTELFHADGKTAGVFYCGLCRIVARTAEEAERCCKPYTCDTCGGEAPRYHTRCFKCVDEVHRKQDEERLQKAEKLSKWDGPVFHPEISEYNGYFENLDALIDYLSDDGRCDIQFAFCCTSTPFNADESNMIESACCDMYEDFEIDSLEGLVDLRAAVGKFNDANAKLVTWNPDYTRAIAVPKIEVEQEP